MRNHLLRLLAGLLVAMPLTLVTSGTAHAYAPAWVTVPNGVLYAGGCQDIQFSYGVDPSAHYWNLDLDVHDPRGSYSSGSYLYDDADPSSGTTIGDNGFVICNWEPASTYTVSGTVEYCNSSYNCTTQTVSTTFQMRLPSSAVSLRVNDRSAFYGQRLRFTANAYGEYPNGGFAAAYPAVAFQKRTAAGWVTFAQTTTDAAGTARATVRWRHRRALPVRAVLLQDDFASSESASFLIR